MDPDDYIKEKGKDNFQKLINNNLSIEEFIWKKYLKDLNTSDPFATTKFEKKFKNLCQSIKDQTLKKHILEYYLEKIRKLTPLQRFDKRKKANTYKVLNETKTESSKLFNLFFYLVIFLIIIDFLLLDYNIYII